MKFPLDPPPSRGLPPGWPRTQTKSATTPLPEKQQAEGYLLQRRERGAPAGEGWGGGRRWGPGPAPSSGSCSRPGTRRRPRPTRRAPVRPAPPRPPRPAPPAPPRPAPPAPMPWGGGPGSMPPGGKGRGVGPGGTAPVGRWPGPVRHARTAPPARPAAGTPTAASGWKAGAGCTTRDQGTKVEGGRNHQGFVPLPPPAWTAEGVPPSRKRVGPRCPLSPLSLPARGGRTADGPAVMPAPTNREIRGPAEPRAAEVPRELHRRVEAPGDPHQQQPGRADA